MPSKQPHDLTVIKLHRSIGIYSDRALGIGRSWNRVHKRTAKNRDQASIKLKHVRSFLEFWLPAVGTNTLSGCHVCFALLQSITGAELSPLTDTPTTFSLSHRGIHAATLPAGRAYHIAAFQIPSISRPFRDGTSTRKPGVLFTTAIQCRYFPAAIRPLQCLNSAQFFSQAVERH